MEFDLINPSAKVRRKRHKPWVFVFADPWAAAQIRVFGDKTVLQLALDKIAGLYAQHNVPGSGERLIEGVALMERPTSDDADPIVLAVHYGPGDLRNTAVVANDAWPENKAVVRSPWGADELDLPAAARGLEP